MTSYIETALRQAFPDAQIRVVDTTGGGDHFDVEVATSHFDGLSMIEQHRLVYEVLGDKVGCEIHALGLRTRGSPKA